MFNKCSYYTLYEGIVIGIITLLIGNIFFFITNTHIKNSNFILFGIGFILHIILEYIGLNKWYCNKKCTNLI